MEKIVEDGLLYDYYGQLLTKHQRKTYEMAVYDDLSLNEIAEKEGVSRQAVHDLLNRTTKQMQGYEEKLGMIARSFRIRNCAAELEQAASEEDADLLSEKVRSIAAKLYRESF